MSNGDRDDLLGAAAGELRRGSDDHSGGDFERDGDRGSGVKKLLLILLPVLILSGGAAGVYYSGILGDTVGETVQAEATTEPQAHTNVYFDLPDMLVNLNSVGPRPNFLKLRATLELPEGTDTTLLTILKPRIIDKFQVYMRELRLNDLRANAGLDRLREELRTEINKELSPIEVKQILFRNILVQ